MSKLIILRGYSGSGKSTFANEWVKEDPDNRVRSNRDDLRASLFAGEGVLSRTQEEFITRIQRDTVKSALTEGKDAILDDTNLNAKFANEWVTFVTNLGFEWEVKDWYVPLQTCLYQNAKRATAGGRYVPVEVIQKQVERYPYPWPELKPKQSQKAVLGPVEPYVEQEGLPFATLFDLDGTLAKNDGSRGWFEWLKVGNDKPHPHVVKLCRDLRIANPGDTTIFLSGRDKICYNQTWNWLEEHVGIDLLDELHMRTEKDNRSDDIVKYELFNQHIRNRFNVRYVVDDRLRVRRLWYAMGLPLLSIGNPDDNF